MIDYIWVCMGIVKSIIRFFFHFLCLRLFFILLSIAIIRFTILLILLRLFYFHAGILLIFLLVDLIAGILLHCLHVQVHSVQKLVESIRLLGLLLLWLLLYHHLLPLFFLMLLLGGWLLLFHWGLRICLFLFDPPLDSLDVCLSLGCVDAVPFLENDLVDLVRGGGWVLA